MYRSPYCISGRKVRFAVVGCGRISGSHFKSIREHQARAELVAVCDIGPETLRRAVSQEQVPGYESLTQMLRDSDADVVALCTPSGLHPQQAIEIAGAGRHVMTEKPMATRLSDGRRMVQACDIEGVHLFVVKQNRLNATLQLLKSAIASS